MNYATISLPANRYGILLNANANTGNAPITSESKPILNMYNSDLNYPGMISAISLPADNFHAFPETAKMYRNQPVTSNSKQLFKRTTYAEVSYDSNPNAFRNDFSLGQQDELPDKISRTLNAPYKNRIGRML